MRGVRLLVRRCLFAPAAALVLLSGAALADTTAGGGGRIEAPSSPDASKSAEAPKPPNPPKPIITEVIPATVFPGNDGRYAVLIRGENFATDGQSMKLLVEGQQSEICWTKDKPATCLGEVIPLPSAFKPGINAELRFEGLSADLKGPRRLQLVSGDGVSQWKDVTFSSVRREAPRQVAFAVLVGIVVLLLLIGIAVKRKFGRGDPRWSPFGFLFLDESTNTYSLSKAQFVMWMAIAVLSYTYLFLCTYLVQGLLTLPEVPAGMIKMLAVSAGGMLAATAVSTTRGSKGAGDLQPSFADFFTHGGSVAPDRIQYFLVTIVAGVAFLLLVLARDAATFTNIPDIPDSLWQFAGVSAAGYVAGKLVRAPGPVINGVTIDPTGQSLQVSGIGLSANARFTITAASARPGASKPGAAGQASPSAPTRPLIFEGSAMALQAEPPAAVPAAGAPAPAQPAAVPQPPDQAGVQAQAQLPQGQPKADQSIERFAVPVGDTKLEDVTALRLVITDKDWAKAFKDVIEPTVRSGQRFRLLMENPDGQRAEAEFPA